MTDSEGRAVLGGAVGAWEWDVPAGRLCCDARFAQLYGLDPQAAFAGMPPSAFFAPIVPEDKMKVRIAVAGAMHGVESFSRDYRIIGPNGAVRWVSARGRPHFNTEGATIRFSGVLTDVTDQKRIEEKLRVAQNAGGVGSFEYICGFGTATVSHQFCRLLGLNPTDALSVRTVNAVVEPGQSPIIDAWDEAFPGALPYTEIAILDGATDQPRWLARRGELIKEPAGMRFVGVVYDITAAKHAETQLRSLTRALEERVETRTRERDLVWNLSKDVFTVVGPDGVLQSVNPAIVDMLGYTPVGIIGTRLRDLLHPDDVQAGQHAFERIMTGESLTDFDCRMRARDGDYRWINWSAVARENEILGVGRDVTQRKQLEDQLRQSQKMEAVGQLTGGLAHDFNNMLTGIIGGLDIIRRRLADNRLADIPRFMDGAQASAERAAALVHRLLAFSRQQSLDFKAVDVNSLVKSMALLLERTLGEQVQLDVVLEPMLPAAATDPNQLESAVLNLALNARYAMPHGGRLTIRTTNATLGPNHHAEVAPGDYVEICVSDTGEGMSPSTLAKVFDPFFTTKPIGEGTGLGLSMIYGFVKQTGGHVDIESALGLGTTIHIYLPRHANDAVPTAATLGAGDVDRGQGEVVLVVEDDPSVRMLVMEVLRDLGYAGIASEDAASALEVLNSSRKVDLLMTDVGLPGMNGRHLADLALEGRPGLPVLFMTGYAEKAAIRAEFLAPGMRMVTKPFSMEGLASEIQIAIADRGTPVA